MTIHLDSVASLLSLEMKSFTKVHPILTSYLKINVKDSSLTAHCNSVIGHLTLHNPPPTPSLARILTTAVTYHRWRCGLVRKVEEHDLRWLKPAHSYWLSFYCHSNIFCKYSRSSCRAGHVRSSLFQRAKKTCNILGRSKKSMQACSKLSSCNNSVSSDCFCANKNWVLLFKKELRVAGLNCVNSMFNI